MRCYRTHMLAEPFSRSMLAIMEKASGLPAFDSITAFQLAAGARAAQIRHANDAIAKKRTPADPNHRPPRSNSRRVIATRNGRSFELRSMREAAEVTGCPRGNIWKRMKDGRYKDWILEFA